VIARSLIGPVTGQIDPDRSVTVHWSPAGRRQFPFDTRTNLRSTTPWQRHTLRATYRTLRAEHGAPEARMAVVRLLNLGRDVSWVCSELGGVS
jgi:hypothetical protein